MFITHIATVRLKTPGDKMKLNQTGKAEGPDTREVKYENKDATLTGQFLHWPNKTTFFAIPHAYSFYRVSEGWQSLCFNFVVVVKA